MPIRRMDSASIERETDTIEREEAMKRPLPPSTFELMGANSDSKVRAIGHNSVIGLHPGEVPTQDLLALVRASDNGDDIERRYRDRIRSPLTAIRAFCVTQCQCGSVKEVTDCSVTGCVFWSFRMGQNPFFGRFKEDATKEDVG